MSDTVNKQRRVISVEPYGEVVDTTFDGRPGDVWQKTLETEVSYDKGGTNLWTYKQEPRGYYLSVSMCERRETASMRQQRFGLFSGTAIKVLVEPAARFSAKRLADITVDPELRERLKQRVLENIARNEAKDAERKRATS